MTLGGEGEPHDAAPLSYPSPSAEAMDAGPFYHANPREDATDSSGQLEHPHVSQVDVKQDSIQDAHMSTHDSSTTGQHVSRPSNLEELQLAAQLGDGLATSAMTDPNMNVDDHAMRNILPHTESEHHQDSSYVQDTSATNHLSHHSMSVDIGHQSVPPQYQVGDGVPPRKRSKVSRACDECRRKKIKCDAPSDNGDTPCSSCARSSIRCLFSRVPQKRGPSKGYIKELADRINSIENKLESENSLTQEEIDKLFASDRPRSHGTPGDELSRKRPFSSISNGDMSTPASARQVPWGSEPRPNQPAPPSSESLAPQLYGNDYMAPQPKAIKPCSTPSKPPVATMEMSMNESDGSPSLDEAKFEEYLADIQPMFPILPNSAARMQQLLSQSSTTLTSAFTVALDMLGREPVQVSPEDMKQHSDALLYTVSDDAPYRRASDIVQAQTLVLFIIDAQWRRSKTLSDLLFKAVNLANTMRLWKLKPTETTDADSDDQLCLRIWWSIVMLDRWYAVSAGTPPLITSSSVVAHVGLQDMLGEAPYRMSRLSRLVYAIAHAISALQPGTCTADQVPAMLLNEFVEEYREHLLAQVDFATFPLVHLCWWHCQLLVTLLTPHSSATETMWSTRHLVNLISASSQLRCPLMHHFVSLAILSFHRLVKKNATREEAMQLIRETAEKASGDSHWDIGQDRLAELLQPASAAEAMASHGLQHLADLATAHEGGAPMDEDEVEVAGPTLSAGYLYALPRDMA